MAFGQGWGGGGLTRSRLPAEDTEPCDSLRPRPPLACSGAWEGKQGLRKPHGARCFSPNTDTLLVCAHYPTRTPFRLHRLCRTEADRESLWGAGPSLGHAPKPRSRPQPLAQSRWNRRRVLGGGASRPPFNVASSSLLVASGTKQTLSPVTAGSTQPAGHRAFTNGSGHVFL